MPCLRCRLLASLLRPPIAGSRALRPQVKVKSAALRDVGAEACWVFAADGGYRRRPVRFPPGGLHLGVAERYELACNFTGYQNKTVYFWNDRDEDLFRDTPHFCHRWGALVCGALGQGGRRPGSV